MNRRGKIVDNKYYARFAPGGGYYVNLGRRGEPVFQSQNKKRGKVLLQKMKTYSII